MRDFSEAAAVSPASLRNGTLLMAHCIPSEGSLDGLALYPEVDELQGPVGQRNKLSK